MAYILVEDFRYGLDTRKLPVTSPPGTLTGFVNGHITRGGEIEKSKAFVSKYALPAGNTFGLAAVNDELLTFGSTASPGTIPSGVTYQQLAHPDGTSDMSEVVFVSEFNSKAYVIAKFTNGDIFHYYDGSIVKDWGAGLVRAGMVNTDGIAAHLASLIDDTNYNVSVAGSVITIEGQPGDAFTLTTTTEDGGGTDDQTATVATLTPAVSGASGVLAQATFDITGGSANTASSGSVELTGGGSGSVEGITVNSVAIMSGAEAFDTDLGTTAQNVVDNINAYTSTPNYTATRDGQTINIFGEVADGADPNGFVVASSATTITTSDTNMSGGVTNAVTSITVDGIEILSERVNWSGSNSTLAANIATQIDNYNSSPEYSGDATGSTVSVIADVGTGSTPNGFTVVVSVAGSVTTSTPTAMAGGVDVVAGQAQVSTVTIGGTFEAADKFTITIDGYPYGITSRPDTKGTMALNFKKKMYSGAGANLHFSKINDPTKVSSEDTGGGFINMANEAQGSQFIKGLQNYFNNLAVFCKKAIQIWSVSADPVDNAQVQVIPNQTTVSAKSIKGFAEGDVMFLARNGIRALKARDSSNFASVSEVGTAIDEDIKALLKGMTEADKDKIVAEIEPLDNRYWLAATTKIFVFSFFSGSKVSAWSIYEPGFTISDFAVIDDFIYARSGDTVYLYGGDNGDQYVSDTVITLPFLDGKNPAQEKELSGIDVSIEGQWKIELAFDPEQPDNFEEVARVNQSSWAKLTLGVQGTTTHIAARFTSLDSAYGKIGNLGIHYDGGETS